MPLQKLLFSATLTQNPEKLQRLGLYQPRLFSTELACGGPRDTNTSVDADLGGKYTFPTGLTVSGMHKDGRGPHPGAQDPADPVLSPIAPLCALQPPLQATGHPAFDPQDEFLQGSLLHQLP